MRRWAGLEEWTPFQLGERTRWKANLRVALVDPGASITVDLQTSPTAEEEDWTTKVTFGAKSAAGVFLLDATKTPTPDFVINPRRDVWIRAVISAFVGEVVAEVTLECPFINLQASADTSLLSQELRTWQDGLSRVLLEAERDVENYFLRDTDTGELDLNLSAPEVHELMKLEISDQAEHLKRKEVLTRSHEPSALVTLRSMPRLFPGIGVRLRPYRYSGSGFIWRGR